MLVVNPFAMKNVGYDPRGDIVPVTMALDFPNVLVMHPDVPAKSLAKYIALRPFSTRIGTPTFEAGEVGPFALQPPTGLRP
jgi:hypothetical protein